MKLKFLITGLFVIALAFVGVTSAHAIDGNTTDVQSTGAVVVSDNSEAGAVPSFTSTLRRGSYGSGVLILQKKLAELGYYKLSLDSSYGPGTASAVAAFQNANSLTADSVTGPNTFARIWASSGAVPHMTLPPVSNTGAVASLTAYSNAGLECASIYEPVCGKVTINCITTPCDQPLPKTFSNKCSLQLAGASYLHSGVCDLTKPTVDDDNTGDDIIEMMIKKLKAEIVRLENHIDNLKEKIEKLEGEL